MKTEIVGGSEKNIWSSMLFITAFLILGWRIMDRIWLKPKKKERMLKQQGFKGNPYTLTRLLFGDVKENSVEYAEALRKTINIHDEAVPRVMPFVHKTIEKYGKMSFMWVGPRPRVLIMDPELMKTVMSKYNIFKKNFKQMIPAFQVSCDEIVNEWKNLVSSSKDGSCVVDVMSHIEVLTTKVVSRTLFATDYAQDKRIYEILKELTAIARQTTRIVDLPGAKYLPTMTNRRSKQIKNELRKSFSILINERAKAIKAGKTTEDNFFHVLLESELAEAHGIKNMDDLIGNVQLFYFAGHETTTAMLVWTMILLSIHQNWQERARQEVFQVFGDRKPDYEGLSQLKITELWGEDANEFKPERFAEGVLKATNGRLAFFPFGSGPRVCIGQNYSLLEAKLVLANILSNFSFELAPTYTHAPYVIFTVQPQYGAPLILHKI
ncbi:cytochrome P450 CYP72A219-like [Olea europaea subsp. europaea]|uniref:Cytochrome P450 CYP72A219-like n=1 Tax=Olea europaea subsp. europaea TaxID=158383 RepID=A0A8S0QGU7_OLEEU|nr:cytochrome P450 CYP72A219-like [Olea europaea subsp. europaea]